MNLPWLVFTLWTHWSVIKKKNVIFFLILWCNNIILLLISLWKVLGKRSNEFAKNKWCNISFLLLLIRGVNHFITLNISQPYGFNFISVVFQSLLVLIKKKKIIHYWYIFPSFELIPSRINFMSWCWSIDLLHWLCLFGVSWVFPSSMQDVFVAWKEGVDCWEKVLGWNGILFRCLMCSIWREWNAQCVVKLISLSEDIVIKWTSPTFSFSAQGFLDFLDISYCFYFLLFSILFFVLVLFVFALLLVYNLGTWTMRFFVF